MLTEEIIGKPSSKYFVIRQTRDARDKTHLTFFLPLHTLVPLSLTLIFVSADFLFSPVYSYLKTKTSRLFLISLLDLTFLNRVLTELACILKNEPSARQKK